MRIVFLGPPGAGKGTQAVRICKDRRIPHISTGNLLRDEISKGTATGLMARAYMDRGLLVPDALVMATVAAKLKDKVCRRGFLLDGFPRNLNQSIALDEFIKRQRMPPLDAVIHFRVPEEVVIRRLTGRRVCQKCGANFHLHRDRPAAEGHCDKCGGDLTQRKDDTLRTVLRRLQVFEEEMSRVLQYYQNRKMLRDVQADQEVADVYHSVRTAIAAGRKAAQSKASASRRKPSPRPARAARA